MGAYSPAPIVDNETRANIIDLVVKPVFEGFKKEALIYTGILYIGLMIKDKKPSVVEFNCRFGDPETQPLLFRIDSEIRLRQDPRIKSAYQDEFDKRVRGIPLRVPFSQDGKRIIDLPRQ